MFWTALFLLAFVFVLTYDLIRTLERIVDPKLVETSENRKPIPYDENVTMYAKRFSGIKGTSL